MPEFYAYTSLQGSIEQERLVMPLRPCLQYSVERWAREATLPLANPKLARREVTNSHRSRLLAGWVRLVLGFVPEPLPDELLYSILARYQQQANFSNREALFADLFGSRRAAAVLDLPGHLGFLTRAIGQHAGLTDDELIDSHTLLPYYTWFLAPERRRQIRMAMVNRDALTVKLKAGVLPSTLKQPRWLKVCPDCAREDLHKYGEPYWHRLHQATGVVVCPKHGTYLVDTSVPATSRRVSQTLHTVPPEVLEWPVRKIDLDSPQEMALLQLASNTDWLLSNIPPKCLSPSKLRDRYHHLLHSKGLATIRGRVFITRVARELVDFYGAEVLRELGIVIDPKRKLTWLSGLHRGRGRMQHPLRHLILISFLGQSAEQFFTLESIGPFGEPPWPCLNPTCNDYLREVISACDVKRDKRTGRVNGTFSCQCGFSYTRWGPDQVPQDRFRKNRVKEYGRLWESRLRQLSTAGLGLKALSRSLHADPHTIRRHLSDLKVATWQQERHARRKQHRELWLALRAELPRTTRAQLAARLPATARWLRSNDREWLEQNSPPLARASAQNSRVDWEIRDKKLASAVLEAADRLQKSGSSIHISMNALSSEMGCKGSLERNLRRLPYTEEALHAVFRRPR